MIGQKFLLGAVVSVIAVMEAKTQAPERELVDWMVQDLKGRDIRKILSEHYQLIKGRNFYSWHYHILTPEQRISFLVYAYIKCCSIFRKNKSILYKHQNAFSLFGADDNTYNLCDFFNDLSSNNPKYKNSNVSECDLEYKRFVKDFDNLLFKIRSDEELKKSNPDVWKEINQLWNAIFYFRLYSDHWKDEPKNTYPKTPLLKCRWELMEQELQQQLGSEEISNADFGSVNNLFVLPPSTQFHIEFPQSWSGDAEEYEYEEEEERDHEEEEEDSEIVTLMGGCLDGAEVFTKKGKNRGVCIYKINKQIYLQNINKVNKPITILKSGDIIFEVNGRPIRSVKELKTALEDSLQENVSFIVYDTISTDGSSKFLFQFKTFKEFQNWLQETGKTGNIFCGNTQISSEADLQKVREDVASLPSICFYRGDETISTPLPSRVSVPFELK